MASAPMTTVTTSRLPAKPRKLGSEPFEIWLNPSGKPEIVVPAMTIARPRKISMPARVTMNAGIPT